jgi:hypothetical protein
MITPIKISLIALGCLFFTEREKIKKEIIEINRAYYSGSETASVDVVTTAYDLTKKKLVSTNNMTIIKTPGYYYTLNGNSESMANKKYKINIHHGKKMMIVTKITDDKAQKKQNVKFPDTKDLNISLDTVLTAYKAVTFLDLNSYENEITFTFKEGAYHKINVVYNKVNYKINAVHMFMLSKGVELEYSIEYTYHKNETISKNKFNEGNYFTLKNGKVLPNERYNNYKLIYNK